MNDQQQSRADALTDEQIESALTEFELAMETDPRNTESARNSPTWARIARAIRKDSLKSAILAASPVEQPASLTAQAEQHADWRGDFERQANAAGFDLSREEFGGEYCHPDSADAFRWYYTGRLDEACSGTTSSQPAAAPIPANETGAEGTNWIPVSHKLPARGEGVLVAVQFDHADDWRMKVGGLSDEGTWTVFGASWTPSHWMPLPPPPRASTQPAMAAVAPADHISQAGKMVSAEGTADERAAFERYVILSTDQSIERDSRGEYVSQLTREWWRVWQARAAASPAAEAVATVEVGGMEHGPFIFQTTPHGADTLPKGTHSLYAAPQPAQADALEEEAYVAKRMAETLATVYATIIGDDPVDADDSLNAIERVMRAAQVLRLEVDLYRAQADAPLPRASGAAEPMTTEQRKALADAERVLAENWEHATADLLHDAFAASVAPAHAAECPHCDDEGVIEADSGASPCACAQDAQEGMPTFGARWTQADAPTGRVVSVSDHVWHGYCAILAILGMEDAGDPVAEVERLKAQADAPAEAREPMSEELRDTLRLAIGYIGSSDRSDRLIHTARINALIAAGSAPAEARV
ncbi:hypothetical protein BTI_1952 [Burkholderia thailandensis MSMB121]|uniref:DUF551 domain-containing protein n=1 Tax=Burkholderia humptydooensis TaxID=430531 RepID=UPI000328033D|nr:DUF551 domain-containing protein [Burkholderia humptydooensis]AGK49267.1 hypothetical protein BTI_1952 [Burkholderia thailandensis MSMB121]ATF36990.1 DUF551 domain-containing protein [Burkholderia thailandensis]KST74359.1 hypothetical protein WS76_09470 [Burkholderia humptydooensis]